MNSIPSHYVVVTKNGEFRAFITREYTYGEKIRNPGYTLAKAKEILQVYNNRFGTNYKLVEKFSHTFVKHGNGSHNHKQV